MKRPNPEFRSRNPEGKNLTHLFHFPTSEFWILTAIPFLLLAAPARAQPQYEPDPWRLCRDLRLVAEPPIHGGDSGGRIYADADSIESPNANVSRLRGNVSILRGVEELFADEALYDRTQQRFELTGNVRYRSPQMELAGERLLSYGDSEAVEIADSEFYLPAQHAAGRAREIDRGGDITTLLDARYSTCDPADPDWEFRASRIRLDHEQGQGFARNMSLRFKDVPIFYFPALSFPIDDRRKSGFLMPTVGDSDKHGFELETPYYWNIAPQADATLTPHLMAERGVKLDSEWRYLNRWSMNELRLEYLDDDKVGASRDLSSLHHSGTLGGGWYSYVDYSEVSDSDYFDDFGSNLSGSSVTHLQQQMRLIKIWENWSFSSQLLDFQTIDEAIPDESHPYRLSPSLELQGTQAFADHVDFSLNTSLTEFEHNLLIAGRRFDIRPRMAFPFGGSGWHLTPALTARHTSYRLEDPALPGSEIEIERDVPTLSLDAGLVFERAIGTDGGTAGGLLQTLEPRVFLLKTPFREQDDIPIFDTRLPDLSFAQLFSENRYLGADRVGDAEQAAVALSSSILQRGSGEEILRAGIGRIYYNEERRVALPGQTLEPQDESGLLAEIRARFSRHWSGSLTLERNSDRGNADKELFRVRYQRDNRRIFNLAYRSRAAEDLEQSDLSFSWPLSDRWSAVGRWNHSLNEDIDLERFAGFQYESCCYAVRIVAREYLTETQTRNSAVFFQLSLKGLGQIGDNMEELLERGNLIYRNP